MNSPRIEICPNKLLRRQGFEATGDSSDKVVLDGVGDKEAWLLEAQQLLDGRWIPSPGDTVCGIFQPLEFVPCSRIAPVILVCGRSRLLPLATEC